jgi:hypothetical protein
VAEVEQYLPSMFKAGFISQFYKKKKKKLIQMIYCKNFCKCHNVPQYNIKKKKFKVHLKKLKTIL